MVRCGGRPRGRWWLGKSGSRGCHSRFNVQRTVLGSMSGTAPSLMELRPVAIRDGSETDGELIVEPIVLDRSMVAVRGVGVLLGMLQRRIVTIKGPYSGELAEGRRSSTSLTP